MMNLVSYSLQGEIAFYYSCFSAKADGGISRAQRLLSSLSG